MSEEFLVFVEEIGESNGYVYRFLFSPTPEVVWGDGFNVTPAITMPGLQPLPLSIEKEWRVVSNIKLETAVESSWFSMQDCMDGIIAIAFSTDEDSSVVLKFGASDNEVREILRNNNIFFQEMDYIADEEGSENDVDDER